MTNISISTTAPATTLIDTQIHDLHRSVTALEAIALRDPTAVDEMMQHMEGMCQQFGLTRIEMSVDAFNITIF